MRTTIEDVQRAETLLLLEVDRVCRENGITYFLSEGTLLGAVRHQGPIPWDDDVDIVLPRGDFERFAAVAPEALGEGFEFHGPDDIGDRAFFDFIPHVIMSDSRLHEDDDCTRFHGGILNHVLLDVFVLDDDTGGFSQWWRRTRLKLVYGLSWGHRYHLDYSKYAGLQKAVVFVLSHVGRLFKQTTLNHAYDRISRSGRGRGDCYFISNTLLQELGCSYRKEWYTENVSADYVGHRLNIPGGYDQILTEVYGDYLKLPPEDSRVPEHIDFDDPALTLSEMIGAGR